MDAFTADACCWPGRAGADPARARDAARPGRPRPNGRDRAPAGAGCGARATPGAAGRLVRAGAPGVCRPAAGRVSWARARTRGPGLGDGRRPPAPTGHAVWAAPQRLDRAEAGGPDPLAEALMTGDVPALRLVADFDLAPGLSQQLAWTWRCVMTSETLAEATGHGRASAPQRRPGARGVAGAGPRGGPARACAAGPAGRAGAG